MIPSEFLQASGLDASALNENRAGRLTPSQAKVVLDEQRGVDKRYFTMAIMMFAVVAIGAVRGMRMLPPSARPIGIAAVCGVPILFVILATSMSSKMKRDVSDEKVLSVDGPIVRGSGRSTHFFRVGDELLKTSRTVYRAFRPSDHRYRAYYLPRTSRIVNLESLE